MSRQTDNRKGYLLPYVAHPQRQGVCIPIPDDINHRAAFLGQLWELTWARFWQGEKAERIEAANEWLEIWHIVSAAIDAEEFCEPAAQPCIAYPNTAGMVQYFPNDPRYTPNTVTEGYNSPAWYFATDASNLAYGTQPGDIVTSLDRFPPGSLPTILPASGLPRVRINLDVPEGAILRTYWRNMLAGSILQFTANDDILTAEFLDLNKDVVSFPPESGDVIIHEWVAPSAGQHHVDFIIVSQINDQLPFLHHGGGFIRFEICGTPAEGAGMDCCDEILAQLAQLKGFYTIGQNDEREADYDGTPESINEDAPPDVFAGGSGGVDLRSDALCLAIRTYVFNQLIKRVERDCANANAIVSLLLGAAGGALGGPIGGIIGGVVGLLISGLICDEIAAWAQDDEAVNDTVCQIYNALYGVEVSQTAFALAFAQLAGEGFVYEALSEDANQQANYLYFLDLLGAAYGQAELGVEGDCDECQELLCGPFDYRESFPVGGQIFSYDNIPVCGARIPGKGMVNTGGPTTTGRYAVAWRHPLNCDQPGSEVWNIHITYENFVTISGDRRIYVWLKDQAGNWIDKLHAGMNTTVGVHNVSIPSYDMTADGSSGPPVEIWAQMVEIVQQGSSAIRSITLQNVP